MPTLAALPPSSPVGAALPAGSPCAVVAPSAVPSGAVVSIGTLTVVEGGDGSAASLVAAAPINAGYAVMYAGAGGCAPADPTSPSYVLAGVATQSGGAGSTIVVRAAGAFAFSAWTWTPGEPVFVLPGGTLTQTAPDAGVLHQVGFALDAVTLLIEPGDPVYL